MGIEERQVSEQLRLYASENSSEERVEYEGQTYRLKCVWFEKTEGEKKGFEFVIPIEHPEYSEEIEQKLSSISKGDCVVGKVKSMNDRGTAWIFHQVDEVKD